MKKKKVSINGNKKRKQKVNEQQEEEQEEEKQEEATLLASKNNRELEAEAPASSITDNDQSPDYGNTSVEELLDSALLDLSCEDDSRHGNFSNNSSPTSEPIKNQISTTESTNISSDALAYCHCRTLFNIEPVSKNDINQLYLDIEFNEAIMNIAMHQMTQPNTNDGIKRTGRRVTPARARPHSYFPKQISSWRYFSHSFF